MGVFSSDIHAIEKDGTNLRLVVKGGGLYDFVFWPGPFSPDGRKLLYTDCHDDCATLLVLDLDTRNRTELSGRAGYGAWSPSGSYIAFGDEWGPGLFVSDPEGTQVRTVLKDVQVGDLSWSLDSTRIAFTYLGGDVGPTGNTGGIEQGGIYEVALDGTV